MLAAPRWHRLDKVNLRSRAKALSKFVFQPLAGRSERSNETSRRRLGSVEVSFANLRIAWRAGDRRPVAADWKRYEQFAASQAKQAAGGLAKAASRTARLRPSPCYNCNFNENGDSNNNSNDNSDNETMANEC